jgi:YegS/Rv2252/BmrU family lipid kinase
MKALIIINPKAGRTTEYQTAEFLRKALKRHGYESHILITTAPGNAELIVSARADQYDLILCSGGDGTLNEVVNGLRTINNPPPISYIPSGTTNDFARGLGLSKDYRDAIDRIFTGSQQSIDAGSANGRRFIYSATFGAFVPSSYMTPQNMKNRLGRLAYLIECIRELPTIKPYHMTVTDDRSFTTVGEYAFGAISNATSIGGFLRYDHGDVDFSDGMHEALLIRYPKNISELSVIIRSLIAGDYKADGIVRFKSSGLRFICDDMPDWALDGEQFPTGSELSFKNIPRTINIFVPDRLAAAS